MQVIKFITSLVKLAVVLVVGGLVFSCVAAIVQAPSSGNSYHTSCSMLQSKDGSGYRTTMDCN